MGTRADFYVAKPEGLEWLGSIAWDGYEIDHVALASTEEQYRQSLEEFFAGRDDVTRPERGWPWPWEDSNTTDYGYVFIEDHGVVFKCFGGEVRSAADPDKIVEGVDFTYPDMSDRKRVRADAGSGIIVVRG